jgi:Protein of unknown function (DUF2846)
LTGAREPEKIGAKGRLLSNNVRADGRLRLRLFPGTLICLLTASCAIGGDVFRAGEAAPKDKALVYVYRTTDYGCQHFADPNFLFINGHRIFAFSCHTYTALDLEPGTYRFSIKKNVFYLPAYEKNGAELYQFSAGSTYYVRYSEDYSFTDTATGPPMTVTASRFMKTESPDTPVDIAQTRYVASSGEGLK